MLDVSKNLRIPHYLVCLKCYCSIQAFTQSPGNPSAMEANKCLWSVPGAFINWSWLCISSLKPVAQYCSASDKHLKISIRLYMEKNLCTLYSELVNIFVLILVLLLCSMMHVQYVLMYVQIPKKYTSGLVLASELKIKQKKNMVNIFLSEQHFLNIRVYFRIALYFVSVHFFVSRMFKISNTSVLHKKLFLSEISLYWVLCFMYQKNYITSTE